MSLTDKTLAHAGTGDMFLKVTGAKHGEIKGESADKNHTREIEVLGWSWGMEQHRDLGGGGPTGRATIHSLKIIKRADTASTALMSALRSNETIKKAILTLRKAGGKEPLEYLKITIEDGAVIAFDMDAGDVKGSPLLFERVSFSFNRVEVEYTGQSDDGIKLGSSVFVDEFSI